MKDHLKQLVNDTSNDLVARCLIREYLQARILGNLQENGVFTSWAFVGGTALRFLYAIPRFSEDLDFSLVQRGQNEDFIAIIKKIKSVFEVEGYDTSIKVKPDKTVQSAFIKFPGLLYELGHAATVSESLSIKIEIDTNPPAGAHLETSIVRRHILLNLFHYDKSSLLAGKLHALLSRKYVKGRDLYDLIWYLSEPSWPAPNMELLANALRQTDWTGEEILESNWKTVLADRIQSFNWKELLNDIRPFLEREKDIELINQESALKLLVG